MVKISYLSASIAALVLAISLMNCVASQTIAQYIVSCQFSRVQLMHPVNGSVAKEYTYPGDTCDTWGGSLFIGSISLQTVVQIDITTDAVVRVYNLTETPISSIYVYTMQNILIIYRWLQPFPSYLDGYVDAFDIETGQMLVRAVISSPSLPYVEGDALWVAKGIGNSGMRIGRYSLITGYLDAEFTISPHSGTYWALYGTPKSPGSVFVSDGTSVIRQYATPNFTLTRTFNYSSPSVAATISYYLTDFITYGDNLYAKGSFSNGTPIFQRRSISTGATIVDYTYTQYNIYGCGFYMLPTTTDLYAWPQCGGFLSLQYPIGSATHSSANAVQAGVNVINGAIVTGVKDTLACSRGYYKSASLCVACPANVYCPGDTTDWKCNAGSYWNGSACDGCAVNFYKRGPGNQTCTACPGNTTTDGLTGRVRCYCPLGQFGPQDQCIACPANTWCPLGAFQWVCPPGSTKSGSTCVACAADKYKPSNSNLTCTSCPTSSNTNGTTGNSVASSCGCIAGKYMSGSTCTACSTGTYCPYGSVAPTSCISTATTVGGSQANISACICKINNYGSNNNCTSCPTNSGTFAQGSTSLNDCVCNAGFYGASGSCTACLAGESCPRNTTFTNRTTTLSTPTRTTTTLIEISMPISDSISISITATRDSTFTTAYLTDTSYLNTVSTPTTTATVCWITATSTNLPDCKICPSSTEVCLKCASDKSSEMCRQCQIGCTSTSAFEWRFFASVGFSIGTVLCILAIVLIGIQDKKFKKRIAASTRPGRVPMSNQTSLPSSLVSGDTTFVRNEFTMVNGQYALSFDFQNQRNQSLSDETTASTSRSTTK